MVIGLSSLWTFSSAQIVNDAANWGNAAWSVTGTYDAASLLANPTASTTFSFDDDNAGSGSADNVSAESPTIDVSAAVAGGETSLTVTADYSFNKFGANESLALEYWDADASTWNAWDAFSDNATSSTYLNCTNGTFTSGELNISAFTSNQQTNFKYRFHYDDDGGWQYGFCISSPTLTSVAGTLPPECATVVAPMDGATGLPIGTTTLKWTASATGEPATSFEVFIGTTSGSLSSFATVTVDTLNVNLLAEGTTFYWKVVPSSAGGAATMCPEWSFATGYYSPSMTQTGPWCDDFESHTAGLGTTTNGWETNPTSGFAWTVGSGTTPSSSTGPTSGNGGSGQYVFTEASSGSAGSLATFYSPNLDLSAMTTPQLTFFYHMYGADMGDLHVDVFNGTSYDVDKVVFSGQQQASSGAAWSKAIVDLSAYSGTVFVRIRGIKGADYKGDMAIDDFCVEETPNCPPPTVLTATNITSTTADLGWTTGGASNWEVVVQAAGGAAPSGSGTMTSTNPYAAMGLTSNTAYEFYVRDDCGGGDYSTWTGPFNFVTPPVNDNIAGAIPITPSAMGTGCNSFTFTAKTANDGTTDSGLDGSCNSTDTGLDRFYSWTATTDALIWNDGAGNPGIVIRDASGVEITCSSTFASPDFQLSGWNVNDDLIIQVYDYGTSNVEVTFCLEMDMLPTAPDCATLVAPVDASSVYEDDPCTHEVILEWAPAGTGSTPATYDVYFGTPGNLTLLETVNAPTTTSIVTVTPGTTHAWQVIPKDAGGNAPAATCSEWTFTVLDGNSGADGIGAGAGGYNYANDMATSVPSIPSYSWIDPVAAGHTEITSWTSGSADDGYFTVPDIGFAFPFYGNSYQMSNVHIGSNGNIQFGASAATSTFVSASIPAAATPNNWIAVMAMDLDAGANGKVYYGTSGGNFVVTWLHYVDYNQPDYITFQVILFNDGNGSIKMQYNDLESTIPMAAAFFDDGLIGIENAAGDDGAAYRDGTGGGGPLFCSPRAVAFSTAAGVLPIELSKFNGKLMTRSNMLTWTTQTERNGSYFEIQRSNSSGLNFETIGRVNAKGNSNTLSAYSFEDEKPSNLAYYRLKMVDIDGSFEYSDVISLLRKEKGFGLYGAYPVPTNAILTVEFTTEEASDMTVELTDVTGRVILTEKFESTSGIQKHDVNMSSLAMGTYFVKLSDGQQTLVQRVVKQ